MPRDWRKISRRKLLLALPSVSLLRGAEPQNALQGVQDKITPSHLFFVRNHFAEPVMSLSRWTLRIEGRVARPIELTFSDLLEEPTRKIEAVLECAGNPAAGFAVSNAVWEGVQITRLLDQAKPDSAATYVLLEGADAGSLLKKSTPLPYSRLVRLGKCLQPESMIALKANDRFLGPSHGFPARALLPGWYGMDSVKWLRRMVVLTPEDQPAGFHASGMDQLYVRAVKTGGGEISVKRVSEILVKSEIAHPSDGARLLAGHHVLWGFAWSGSGVIAKVELSTDGGRSWHQAKLESSAKSFAWVRWTYGWEATPGEHQLMSRAWDTSGNQQPIERDPARQDSYELNWCAPVHCSVI